MAIIYYYVTVLLERTTSKWAQDCPSEWQDCPNVLGLVGAKLGSHEGTDLRFYTTYFPKARWISYPLPFALKPWR